MANPGESPSLDVLFRGTDGNECEAFIVVIRELAYEKGKDEDQNWMLRYATTRLRGRALRWHAKLDPSIRKDWDLLVQAMLEEYPMVEARNEDGIATPVWTSTTFSPAPSTTTLPENDYPHSLTSTPRPSGMVQPQGSAHLGGLLAPPPQVYDPSAPGIQVGRLRVVYEDGGTRPHYVWWGRPHPESCGMPCNNCPNFDTKNVTTNIPEALIVSFIPSSEPHQIVCMNSKQPTPRNLGIQLFLPDHLEFHPLTGARGPAQPYDTSFFRSQGYMYQVVSTIWNVLADGTLRATLTDLVTNPANRSGSYSTTTAYVEISGATISFVKDYITPQSAHPTSQRPIVRSRIVFEPI